MAFKMVQIISSDTIKVTPNWEWTTPDGKRLIGNELKIRGYKIPTSSHANFAVDKLKMLLTNKEFILKNPKIDNVYSHKFLSRQNDLTH